MDFLGPCGAAPVLPSSSMQENTLSRDHKYLG